MKMGAIVLDSDDSDMLSTFYQKLLGWKKEKPDDEWIVLTEENGKGTPLVFQQIEHYQRPAWPAEPGRQQQMIHLDFYVKSDELDKAVEHALTCGAAMSEVQLSDDWKVMLDPAGHPFCIIPIPLEFTQQSLSC